MIEFRLVMYVAYFMSSAWNQLLYFFVYRDDKTLCLKALQSKETTADGDVFVYTWNGKKNVLVVTGSLWIKLRELNTIT